ncbi:MAG TPA: four helix bundle protein [Planctomycetota bacterium]|nr:four helix bundle protein [Planctomycetota bacterium]
MRAKELKERTKRFAVPVVKMFRALPKVAEARILGRQVIRSGTSVAANYRAACRARSKKEFAAKLGIVVEEIDETVLWLEILVESEIVSASRMRPLLTEANELLSILAASYRTARPRDSRQITKSSIINHQIPHPRRADASDG